MDGPPDSPFRRDEPVSGTSLWLWLTGAVAAFWILFMIVRAFVLGMVDHIPWLVALTGVVQLVFVWSLFRAAARASKCRKVRNFEVMAQAVRAQTLVWGLVVVGGFLALAGLTILMDQLADSVHRIEGYKKWLQSEKPTR